MAKKPTAPSVATPLEELILKIDEAIGLQKFDNFDQLYTLFCRSIEEAPRGMTWALALARKAIVQMRMHGDLSGGLHDALNAYYYFREVKDEKGQCNTCSLIAYCYMRVGLLDRAVEHLNIAHILARKNNLHENAARSLKLLADAHGIMKNYEAVVRYCSDALELCRQHNLPSLAVGVHFSMTQAYNHLGKYQEALAIAEEEFSLFEQHKDIRNLDMIYTMQAITYQSMGEFSKALSAAKRSENILTELPLDVPRRWQATLQKCLCLCDADKAKQALQTGKKILKECPIKNDYLFLQALHSMMARAYTMLKDNAKAALHTQKEKELELQHTGEELQLRVKSLTIAFDAERFQLEAQLERRRVQQLEEELQNKEKELTMLALNLAQKNEMLAAIEHKLQSLEKSLSNTQKDTQSSMKVLISGVKADISSVVHTDKAWEIFEQQFVTIHPGFVERLSQKHTNFKPMELRLCALLKVNLSTKQIAHILCIDSASVDVYRSRIRRKIGMDRGSNLTAYLSAL